MLEYYFFKVFEYLFRIIVFVNTRVLNTSKNVPYSRRHGANVNVKQNRLNDPEIQHTNPRNTSNHNNNNHNNININKISNNNYNKSNNNINNNLLIL